MAQENHMSDEPRNPYLVLAAAAVLPGAGHVLQGKAQRGLSFLFFILVFGWVSVRLTPPDASFFARHAGGIFIYGLSVIDAYKSARIAWETWKYKNQPPA